MKRLTFEFAFPASVFVFAVAFFLVAPSAHSQTGSVAGRSVYSVPTGPASAGGPSLQPQVPQRVNPLRATVGSVPRLEKAPKTVQQAGGTVFLNGTVQLVAQHPQGKSDESAPSLSSPSSAPSAPSAPSVAFAAEPTSPDPYAALSENGEKGAKGAKGETETAFALPETAAMEEPLLPQELPEIAPSESPAQNSPAAPGGLGTVDPFAAPSNDIPASNPPSDFSQESPADLLHSPRESSQITPQNADPLAATLDESAVVANRKPPRRNTYQPRRPQPLQGNPALQENPRVAVLDRSFPPPIPKEEPRTNMVEGTGTPGSLALEGPQQPLLILEKAYPKELQVGQPAVLKTVVKNIGKIAAKEIVVHDRVPKGTRLVSTNPTASIMDEGELLWSLGELAPQEQMVVEMEVVPLREGEIGSVATAQFSVESSGRSVATQAMLLLEMTANKEVHLGEEITFNLVLSNPGTGTAKNTVLEVHVPEGMVHKEGKELVFSVGELKPKEAKQLPLVLKCVAPGTITNRIKAKADNNLESIAEASVEVLAPAMKLKISGSKQRYLERKSEYTLTVSNSGTATAHGIALVAKLPAGMSFVSTNQNGLYDAATHSVHWALVELPARQSGEIELVLLPIKEGEQSLHFEGSGENGLKASDAFQVAVSGLSALSFEVQCLTDPVEQGKPAKYEVKVTNRGSKASQNVVVDIRLSEGMQFTHAEGPTKYKSNAGIIQFDPLGVLEARSEKTYKFSAKCLAIGDHRVSVSVQSDELRAPITKEESTQVFGDK